MISAQCFSPFIWVCLVVPQWCVNVVVCVEVGSDTVLQLTTNFFYHCSVESLQWLSSKAKEEWKIHNSDHRWWQILKRSWHSKLPLVAKVFIWRVLIGGLPLGLALKRLGITTGNCFFCTIQMEDNTHRFIHRFLYWNKWKFFPR